MTSIRRRLNEPLFRNRTRLRRVIRCNNIPSNGRYKKYREIKRKENRGERWANQLAREISTKFCWGGDSPSCHVHEYIFSVVSFPATRRGNLFLLQLDSTCVAQCARLIVARCCSLNVRRFLTSNAAFFRCWIDTRIFEVYAWLFSSFIFAIWSKSDIIWCTWQFELCACYVLLLVFYFIEKQILPRIIWFFFVSSYTLISSRLTFPFIFYRSF